MIFFLTVNTIGDTSPDNGRRPVSPPATAPKRDDIDVKFIPGPNGQRGNIVISPKRPFRGRVVPNLEVSTKIPPFLRSTTPTFTTTGAEGRVTRPDESGDEATLSLNGVTKKPLAGTTAGGKL